MSYCCDCGVRRRDVSLATLGTKVCCWMDGREETRVSKRALSRFTILSFTASTLQPGGCCPKINKESIFLHFLGREHTKKCTYPLPSRWIHVFCCKLYTLFGKSVLCSQNSLYTLPEQVHFSPEKGFFGTASCLSCHEAIRNSSASFFDFA